MTRRTYVCRPDLDAKGQPSCVGGGFWVDDPEGVIFTPPMHKCGKRMIELAPTTVTHLGRSTDA